MPNGSMSASSSTSDIRSAKLGSEADDQPLWRRPQARRHMSLGHFNEFGQYVSDVGLENIPNLDKKKGMSLLIYLKGRLTALIHAQLLSCN